MNHERKLIAAPSMSKPIYFTALILLLESSHLKKKKLVLRHNEDLLVLKYSCVCYEIVCHYSNINLLNFSKSLPLRLKEDDRFEFLKYYA